VYAWASVVGLLLAVALFFGYALPFGVRSIGTSASALFTSHSLDRTVDSVLTLVLFGANLGLIGYVLWRDQPAAPPVPPPGSRAHSGDAFGLTLAAGTTQGDCKEPAGRRRLAHAAQRHCWYRHY